MTGVFHFVDLLFLIEYNYLTLKDKFGYNDMIDDSKINEILRLVGTLVRRNIHKREGGTVIGEGALLACLSERGSMTVGELCEVSRLGSGRMANLLKTTEAKGYVQRRRDETDGRKVWVTITQKGSEEGKRRMAEIFSRCRKVLETLGEEDTETVARILRKLTDLDI